MAAATSMDLDEGAANVLTDKYFRDLASELGKNWENLATQLDFRNSEIEKIKMNHLQNVDNQIFEMLVKWRQTLGTITQSHKDCLCQSLRKVGRNDLAIQLEEMECEEVDSSYGAPHGHTNRPKKPAESTAEMSFIYTDPNCKINVKSLKITGKDNAVIVGTVKDSTFNFN